MLFPPVELCNQLRSNAKIFKTRADTERCYDRNLQLRDLAHRRARQMIVVIVREEYRVERKHFSERCRHGMKASSADERNRRSELREHGIDQHTNAVALYQ